MAHKVFARSSYWMIKSGTELGTITKHQFVLATDLRRTPDKALEEFALLPDDYVVGLSSGEAMSVGHLRRTLRQRGMKNNGEVERTLATDGHWPGYENNESGLLPLDCMDCGFRCAEHFLFIRNGKKSNIEFDGATVSWVNSDLREFTVKFRTDSEEGVIVISLWYDCIGWLVQSATLTTDEGVQTWNKL